jgi:tripartite-type tricarboxylate transporter receptor subunit TctC
MKRLAAILATLVLAAGAQAQDYPNRPIRILQGFAPGGNADNIARILGAEMSKGLGQPVVVESRPGAGGNIAANAVATSSADGYTLLLAVGGHSVSGALYKSLPYRTVEDFAWISTATVFPFLISVNAGKGPKTLGEMVQMAKSSSQRVTFGSAGVGSTQHLIGELLASVTGSSMVHVAYKGDSASLTGLLGGETTFVVAPATAVLPLAQGGRLRVLGVTHSARWKGMPDVPTVEEAAGIPEFDVGSWAGLAAAAGTPQSIVMRLHSELQKTLQMPEVRTRLEGFGGEVRGSTPEEMRARITREVARWSKVIDEAKIERR